jgi:hypothetical protein
MTFTFVAATIMFGFALTSTFVLVFQTVVILACVKDIPQKEYVNLNYYTNNLIYLVSILWATFFFLVRL